MRRRPWRLEGLQVAPGVLTNHRLASGNPAVGAPLSLRGFENTPSSIATLHIVRWTLQKQALLCFGLLGAIMVLAMACGGTPTPRVTVLRPPVTPATPTPCVGPALEISVKGDAIAFDKDRCEATAGTEVVMVFDNVSGFNQHNWVLVRAGTKDTVAERGLKAGPGNDWLESGDSDVIAHTRLLDPGEEGEVRFTAPEPGSYQFVCTSPGQNTIVFGDFVVTP